LNLELRNSGKEWYNPAINLDLSSYGFLSSLSNMKERTPTYRKFARFYDELGWDRFSKNRAKLVLDYIREKAPHVKSLLDLACGTGEFAILMAAQGISVTGIDISKDMLKVARSKANTSASKSIRFIQADMTRFRLNRKFDLVTCNFDSLNHLLFNKDILSTFQNAYKHLSPKGCFIFDMNTIQGLRGWRYQSIEQRDDSLVLQHGVFDEKTRIATMFIDGFVRTSSKPERYTRFQETIPEKGYPIRILCDFLMKAGFKRMTPLGSSVGKSRSQLEKDSRVVFCAWK